MISLSRNLVEMENERIAVKIHGSFRDIGTGVGVLVGYESILMTKESDLQTQHHCP